MKIRLLRAGTCAVALVGPVAGALGQVTLVSQQRGLSYFSHFATQPPLPMRSGGGSGGVGQGNFGDFSVTLAPQDPQQGDPIVSELLSQDSRLRVNDIQGEGTAVARITTPEDHYTAMSQARSYMTVGFSVDRATRFHFVASATLTVERAKLSTPLIEMHLTGPGGAIYDGRIQSADDPDLAVDARGFFEPGTYELHASVRTRIDATDGTMVTVQDDASFALRLQMGCPADFNFDGTIGSQDFFDYLAAFFGGSASADYTEDGQVDSSDFFRYLDVFLAGGC